MATRNQPVVGTPDAPAAAGPEALLPPALLEGVERIRRAGGQAWITGQALREALVPTGGELRKAEVIASLDPARARAALEGHPGWTLRERAGRVTRYLVAGTRGGEPLKVQVAPLRTRVPGHPWYRRHKFDPLVRDLASREITLHAFAWQPGGEVIDPFGGVSDLRRRYVRPVVPASVVFKEGGVWLLKVAAYVAWYGFDVPSAVFEAAQRDHAAVIDVPPGQWPRYFERILLGDHPTRAMRFLQQAGVLRCALPEVDALVGFHESCPVHHKDLWAHTLEVLERCPRNLAVRWAALVHDIGKIATRSVVRGKVQFLRHEEMGAFLFKGLAARMDMNPELAARVEAIVRHHSRVNLYDEEWTDSAVRRLVREMGDLLDDLLAFSRADFTTKRVERQRRITAQLDELEARIAKVIEEAQRVPPLPKGLGLAIIEAFDLDPGPRIGELRRWLEARVEAGELEAQQPFDYYLEALRTHREELGL